MKNYRAPKSVQTVACQGLQLREQYGRGGVRVGITRAHQLCKGKPLSFNTVKRMNNFFNRHSAFISYHGQTPPSNSEISWKLWGGNPGRSWAKRITEKEIVK